MTSKLNAEWNKDFSAIRANISSGTFTAAIAAFLADWFAKCRRGRKNSLDVPRAPGKFSRSFDCIFLFNEVLSTNFICRVSDSSTQKRGRATAAHWEIESRLEHYRRQAQELPGNPLPPLPAFSPKIKGKTRLGISAGTAARIYREVKGWISFFPSSPSENAPPGTGTRTHVISLRRSWLPPFRASLLRFNSNKIKPNPPVTTMLTVYSRGRYIEKYKKKSTTSNSFLKKFTKSPLW